MSTEDVQAYDIRPQKRPEERPGDRGGAREKNRQMRTETLVNAGLTLFLVHGIDAVSIQDIANEAEMAKGSFYRYFDDKTSLIETMIRPVTVSFQEASAQCSASLRSARSEGELATAYSIFALQLSALFLRHQHVVRLYLQESRIASGVERAPLRDLAAKVDKEAFLLTEAAMSHGLIRPLNPTVSALAVVGAVEKLLLRNFTHDDLGQPTAVASAIIELVLNGIRVT